MTHLRLRYENNRPTDDIEVILENSEKDSWVVSFVATVPHYCESPRVFGDLFDRRLEEIDSETLPIARRSNRELEIIQRLRDYANTTMTSDEQHRLLHAKFPGMSETMVAHRTLLWLLGVLEERRQRDDANLRQFG
jgi:hypothetical protein